MSKFNEISLKIKTVPAKAKKGYNIFTDKDNFTYIEAETVAQALEKSGVKNPIKIEPAGFVNKSIFYKSELADTQKIQENPRPPVT